MRSVFDQPVFCSLLRYYQQGNYNTFRRICEIALHEGSAEDPFVYANMFISSQICGMINTEGGRSTISWHVSFDSDISIVSNKPKSIGTCSAWFEQHYDAEPLVTDDSGRTLLFGAPKAPLDLNQTRGIEQLFQVAFPSLRSLEKGLCLRESYRADFEGSYEMFDPISCSWSLTGLQTLENIALIRTQTKFFESSYFLISPKLRLLFRLLSPEWAFPFLLYLSNIEIEKILVYSSGNLIIPRAIRLPVLIYRRLFVSCAKVQVGKTVKFVDLDVSAYHWLINYLSPSGVRHAA